MVFPMDWMRLLMIQMPMETDSAMEMAPWTACAWLVKTPMEMVLWIQGKVTQIIRVTLTPCPMDAQQIQMEMGFLISSILIL